MIHSHSSMPRSRSTLRVGRTNLGILARAGFPVPAAFVVTDPAILVGLYR